MKIQEIRIEHGMFDARRWYNGGQRMIEILVIFQPFPLIGSLKIFQVLCLKIGKS